MKPESPTENLCPSCEKIRRNESESLINRIYMAHSFKENLKEGLPEAFIACVYFTCLLLLGSFGYHETIVQSAIASLQ